jgi:hypothetical protein
LQIYLIFTSTFARFCKFQKLSRKESAKESAKEKGADVNDGKFVLDIDFIMALKPDCLCVYETTKQDSI